MLFVILLSLCLLSLDSSSSVLKVQGQSLSQVVAYSPTSHSPFASHPYHNHHHRHHHRRHSKNYSAPSPSQLTSPQYPPTVSPTSFTPPQSGDCDEISCSPPLTKTAIGSPCGCVYPIRVVLDIAVASYIFLTLVPELEVDIAAGTFLKQSQVKITSASPRDEGRTGVTVELVPLGSKFDKMTALLIYERFWQKKVTINKTLFHEYKLINIDYPGLPLPPPTPNGSDNGGNHQYPITANVSDDTSQKMNARIVAVIAVSSFMLLLLSVGAFILVLKVLKHKKEDSVHGLPPSLLARRSGAKTMIPSSIASSTSASFLPNISTCPPLVKTFTLVELEKATYGFNASRKLGEGGFGCVYHGILEDGSDVAVKLLKRVDQDRDREREFISEVEILSRLHHRNLVKLIGVCIEEDRHCLVYELVRNGSVESHLHGVHKEKGILDWDARMKIALGSARALAYLHEDSNPRVIHRDFKASNILLEDDFTPKVSDFGLAREATEGTQQVSTIIMGTFGYVAPEYALTGHLLIKSDVYSYGVVLLELLSGRKPVRLSHHHDPESLVVWARPLLGSKEGLQQLIDPYLQQNYDFDTIAKVAAVASMCIHEEPSQRPFMGEVVQALKLVSNSKDEADCDNNSYSQNDSSSAKGELFPESSWCSQTSTQLGYFGNYADRSVFLNMDCSSGSIEAATPRVGGRDGSQSDPCRMKKIKNAFQRLRGTVSEHGYPLKRPH